MPTVNMDKQTPIWLSSFSVPKESGGKTKMKDSGASSPSNEGPSRMPAAIYPGAVVFQRGASRRLKRRCEECCKTPNLIPQPGELHPQR